MKCSYACGSPDHRIARRFFLGSLGAGLGAAAGLGGFGAFARPAAAGQLARDQKRVLVVFLAGGSSQLETWDPKPKTETGGPFRAIPTTVPGVHICELLPQTALQMHRLAIVRSVNTNENDHGKGRYLMETGRPQSPAADYPHLGAVTAKALTAPDMALPGHVHVSARGGGSRRNDAAYLGPQFGSIVVAQREVDYGTANAPKRSTINTTSADRRSAVTSTIISSAAAAPPKWMRTRKVTNRRCS